MAVATLPRLRLAGLMAIPAPAAEFRRPTAAFRPTTETGKSNWPTPDWYWIRSIAGMSDDLEAAIAEGATLVRIGTALFGSRP
jgi:uncharacterized pyridoxal phosphate-containing UPF0001 family protein